MNVSLLRAFSTSSATVLDGHFMSVNSASFSQDGERAFTGSDDRTVRIWDARLGIPLSTVSDLKSGVACLAVSPDGKRLVVGTKDGEIATYAVSGDNPAREQGRGLGNTYARFVTFNPDGSEVVICCLDGSVLFLNAEDLAEKDRFSISPGGATCVSFDRTGRRMAVAGSDRLITVRDAVTKEIKATYSGHKDWVRSGTWEHTSAPSSTRSRYGSRRRPSRRTGSGSYRARRTGLCGCMTSTHYARSPSTGEAVPDPSTISACPRTEPTSSLVRRIPRSISGTPED